MGVSEAVNEYKKASSSGHRTTVPRGAHSSRDTLSKPCTGADHPED